MPALGSWSAPTYNEVAAQEFSPFKSIEWTFTGSADDGSVPDLVLSAEERYWLSGKSFYMAEIIPGSAGPTADYDISIEDAAGDIFEDALKDLSATLRERRRPQVNGKEDVFPYDGRALTIKVAGNSVHSAVATLRLFMWR